MVKKKFEQLFQAMYHGKYDFRDFATGDASARYKPHEFEEKNTGRKRLTYVPDKTLKIYHAFLNQFIFDYLEVNERVVFSYRKGVNVASAVTLHVEGKHFFQADIKGFFPSINADLVRNSIRLAEGVCPIDDLAEYIERVVQLVTVDGKIPLGFSTSPTISNAVLKPFDDRFEEYCHSKGLVYSRYSDDLIVSGQSKEELTLLPGEINRILLASGLGGMQLNATKTRISSVGRKVKLLGVMILPNGTISVDTKLKNFVETALYLYSKDTLLFRDFLEMDVASAMERISGYVNYICTIDKSYVDYLRRRYGVTVIDTFIHYSKK